MRLLTITLLAMTVQVLFAANASAYAMWMTAESSNGQTMGPAPGWSSAMEWLLAPSDTLTISVWLDTEGAGDIALLGVGVVFDSQELAYDQAASSTTSYLLYTATKAPYLVAASTCGGGYGSPNAGDGCNIYGLDPEQVQLDFISNSLPAGVPGTGVAQLVELVFHVHDVGDGIATIDFRFEAAMGGILQLGDASQPELRFVPEPTTALLIGLGLAGLGLASRRGSAR